jgi:hypothetical protein
MVDLTTIASAATALTVIVATVFGVMEVRAARRDREERAAFEAVHAIMTPQWIRSVALVQSLPDTLGLQDVEADERVFDAARNVGLICEGLGYAVFAGLVPIDTVDDLIGGSVRVAWRKLSRYVIAERERSGSPKSWEWFQWLAEELERHSGDAAHLVPAYEAHRGVGRRH